MWLRTLILLTLAISAFGHAVKNGLGEYIEDAVQREISEWPQNVCKNMKAEIVFIIDGSASIYPNDFRKQIEFLESFVDHFTIGKNNVRVGAVTFGDKIIMDNTFGLSQYTSKDRLKSGLSQIDFRHKDGSRTETYLAIKYARETLFRYTRPDVRKIAIVITDGRSTIPAKTKNESRKMRNDGIVIFAIGVGKNASNEELRVITNRKDYVFMIDKYSLLKEIQDKLSEITCISTPDQGCKGKVDINFVFDSSSMGYEDTNTVSTFIMESIAYEDFSEQNLRFGTITGKCQAMKSFYLDSYRSRQEVRKHFDNFHRSSIASLLEESLKEYFTYEYGGREGVRKVAVIFLKGKLSNPQRVITNARSLRQSGIEVFVIKMDEMNSPRTLERITGKRNILDATETSSMKQLSSEFLNRLCHR